MNQQTIRILYPSGKGRISLRTEHDWHNNVQPVAQKDGASEFAIETSRPFFYFKPVLLNNGQVQWARGENSLAVATSGTPLDDAERGEMATRVRELLRQLSPAHERAVQRAFFDGWTHEEIARHEGMPLGTVKSHVRRGMERLRALLADHDTDRIE